MAQDSEGYVRQEKHFRFGIDAKKKKNSFSELKELGM